MIKRRGNADISLTNQKPSAIYRLRPHLPPDAPLPTSTPTQAANLGIEIAPLTQLEQLLSTIGGAAEGKGKEVAGKVDVGKVAEKVVKNVRSSSLLLLLSFVSPFLARSDVALAASVIQVGVRDDAQLSTFLRGRGETHVSLCLSPS
jgi:hypothetical protein